MTLFVEKGGTQPLAFLVRDPAGKTLEILAPSSVRVLSFSPDGNGKISRLLEKIPQGKETLYRIAFRTIRKAEGEILNFTVLVPENAGDNLPPLRYRAIGENRHEAWNIVQWHLLPQLKTSAPEKIRIEAAYTFNAGSYCAEEAGAILRTMKNAGINTFWERIACYGNPVWVEAARKNNMHLDIEFHCRAILSGAWRKIDPLSVGKGLHLPAPVRQITVEKPETARQRIRQFVERYRPDSMVVDLEYNPSTEFDASKETRKRFADFAGLDHVPEKQEITEKHFDRWVDFCCRETRDFLAFVRSAVKACSPGTRFGIYSAYPGDRNRKIYSVDWELLSGIADFGTMGYGFPNPAVTRKTLAVFGGTPAYSGILLDTMKHSAIRELKVDLVRRILHGYQGVMFWTWKNLDGVARSQIAGAASLLAEYEDFFLEGKRLADFRVSGTLLRQDSFLLEKNGELLLIVCNGSDSPRKGKVIFGKREIPLEAGANDVVVKRL